MNKRRMPSILFCTQAAYVGGGVEQWLWSLCQGLETHGWDVQVALAEGPRFHAPARYLARYPFKQAHVVKVMGGSREERYLALRRLVIKLNPALVIPVHLADALYTIAKLKRIRRNAPRLVTCLHGHMSGVMQDLQVCRGDIDLAVSVSKRGAERLVDECGMPAGQVVHIPTGVPMPTTSVLRSSDRLVLGYVGRLDQKEKRIRDLPALVKKLGGPFPVQFHIAGAGTEESWLREQLAAEVMSGRVVFHGLLARSELYRQIYPMLQGLLIFSEAEGGPIVAWEAMVHGVVPVVSDFTGRLEEGVLRDGQNCLVFPVGDMAACASQIRSLLVDDQWFKLSDQARKLPPGYMEADFAEAWHHHLNSVLERPSRIGQRPLPALVSGGRLAVSSNERISYWLRRFAGSTFDPADPGDEWPHAYGMYNHLNFSPDERTRS